MLTVLDREERVAPLESSVEDLAGRLLMNYADGTKHEDAEEIKITSKSLLETSDAQQVCNDVASDGIFKSVTCEESAKDKDKLSKGRQPTEKVKSSQKVGKVGADSQKECEKNEEEKLALGFYRVLQNPVKINGNTKEETNKINTADNSEEKGSVIEEQRNDDCRQDNGDCRNNEEEEGEEKQSNDGECNSGDISLRSDNSKAPIAFDEDLTTYTEVSSDDFSDDNHGPSDTEESCPPDIKSTNNMAMANYTEASDLFQMEKELKVFEVKFRELAREIQQLEKNMEAGAGEIENLEFELKKVEAECDKNLQHKEGLERHLREGRSEDRNEVTTKVLTGQMKESFSCIEDRSKDEIALDNADNEEMENREPLKTDEETFFSLTPSDVSEEEKTFSVKLETTDVATETVDDEISARVEENHSDLLLNCLVRYQPPCLAFPAKTLLMSFSLFHSDSHSPSQLSTSSCGKHETSRHLFFQNIWMATRFSLIIVKSIRIVPCIALCASFCLFSGNSICTRR